MRQPACLVALPKPRMRATCMSRLRNVVNYLGTMAIAERDTRTMAPCFRAGHALQPDARATMMLRRTCATGELHILIC